MREEEWMNYQQGHELNQESTWDVASLHIMFEVSNQILK